jgi:hypothetical protein
VAILKYIQNPDWREKLSFDLGHIHEAFKNRKEIPCNICDEATALEHVKRKHLGSTTWNKLEEDYFNHYFNGADKTPVIKFEEATGLISSHPKLNEDIMERIIKPSKLNEIGFSYDEKDNLVSVYDDESSEKILEAIVELKKNRVLQSRRNNGHPAFALKPHLEDYGELEVELQSYDEERETNTINTSLNGEYSANDIDGGESQDKEDEDTSREENDKTKNMQKTKRRTKRRTTGSGNSLLPGDLRLERGQVNDLYMDIFDLYGFYESNQDSLTDSFPILLRMSLRLLVETAADGKGYNDISPFIAEYYEAAKDNLDKDQKTTLHTQNVRESTVPSLLHIGAHPYETSKNYKQVLAIGTIVGEILALAYPKEDT